MCVVSMVMDQWWPPNQPAIPTIPNILPAPPVTPNVIPWPMIQKDPELAKQMLEVLTRLEAIDRKLGLLEQCSVTRAEKKRTKDKLRRIAKKAKHS